jgi:TRAP-type C4-dicarboxylate transport system permease small subunit
LEADTHKEPVRRVSTSGFAKFVLSLSKVVDSLSRFGAALAGTMMAAMMFLTFFDVAGRQIGGWSFVARHTSFFKSIIGSYEITGFMMLLLISFGLAYCALFKGHIRVDLVLQYTPKKVSLWFDAFASGIACIFYAFLVWQSWLTAWDYLADKSSSSVLIVPLYPFVFLLVIGASFLVLAFFRDFLQSIDEAIK